MKHSLFLSLLIFVCLGAYAQKKESSPQDDSITILQASVLSLQDSIQSLQATVISLRGAIQDLQGTALSLMDSIQNVEARNKKQDLHTQVDFLEKEVVRYQNHFSMSVNDYNDKMDHWLTFLTIIFAIIGIGVPYLFNKWSEKNIEKLLKEASEKADNAKNALIDFDPKIKKAEEIVTTIEGLKDNVVEATRKAKAVQYFVQALQETDDKKAISLYSQSIKEDKKFAEAYNNRGVLKRRIKDDMSIRDSALGDFSRAIELSEIQGRGVYAEAYNNRGILFFENNDLKGAEFDFDVAISKDYADAYLNRGLLKYQKGKKDEASIDFNNAIAKNPNFAEAYYIRGLCRYNNKYDRKGAIEDIRFAIAIKNHVVERYPNRCLLTGKMKVLDNSINEVGFSKDLTKIMIVSKDKKDPFMVLASIKEIEDGAFSGCTQLNEIIADENNNFFQSKNGILFSKDMSKLIAVPGGKDTIVIPDSVTKIEGSAIKDCSNLTELHLKQKTPVDFSSAFLGLDKSKVTIYVPKGSSDAYSNSECYKEFKDIIKEE